MATSSFEELMQAVADLAGRAVPAAAACGITLSQDGHVITVASAALARLLDEQQIRTRMKINGTITLTDGTSAEFTIEPGIDENPRSYYRNHAGYRFTTTGDERFVGIVTTVMFDLIDAWVEDCDIPLAKYRVPSEAIEHLGQTP